MSSDNSILVMSNTTEGVVLNIKPPKRVLHFSDGVLEESDSDIEDKETDKRAESMADTHPITVAQQDWPVLSSAVNNVVWLGSKTLEVCDYIGEGLANFFGITSPKYEYEIEEYKKRVEEEVRSKEKLSQEFSGWTQSDENIVKTVTINSSDIKREENGFKSKATNN